HLDLLLAVAFARLATAARLVETKALRPVAADFRLGELSEELPDQVENTRIRRGVRTGRIADRVLIDADDLVDLLQAGDVVERGGNGASAVQLAGKRVVEDFLDQRTLARAADACDGNQGAEREGDVDVFQVVLAGTLDDERGFLRS